MVQCMNSTGSCSAGQVGRVQHKKRAKLHMKCKQQGGTPPCKLCWQASNKKNKKIITESGRTSGGVHVKVLLLHFEVWGVGEHKVRADEVLPLGSYWGCWGRCCCCGWCCLLCLSGRDQSGRQCSLEGHQRSEALPPGACLMLPRVVGAYSRQPPAGCGCFCAERRWP